MLRAGLHLLLLLVLQGTGVFAPYDVNGRYYETNSGGTADRARTWGASDMNSIYTPGTGTSTGYGTGGAYGERSTGYGTEGYGGRSTGYGTGGYGGRSTGYDTEGYGGRSTGPGTGAYLGLGRSTGPYSPESSLSALPAAPSTWGAYDPTPARSARGAYSSSMSPEIGNRNLGYISSPARQSSLHKDFGVVQEKSLSDPWSDRGSIGSGRSGPGNSRGTYSNDIDYIYNSQTRKFEAVTSPSPGSSTGVFGGRTQPSYDQSSFGNTGGTRTSGSYGQRSAAPARSQQDTEEMTSNQLMEKYGHLMDDQKKPATEKRKWAPLGSKEFFDEVDQQLKSDEFKKTGKVQWTIFSGETDPKKNWRGTGLSYDEIQATHDRYMKDYVPPPDLEGVNMLESLLEFIKKECPEALENYKQFDDTPKRIWGKGNVPQQERMKQRVEVPLLLINGELYGKLKVGSSGQVLSVLFDTGSHHIYVVAEGAAQKDNQAYHSKVSTTFKTENAPCQDQFGSGNVQGVWGYDTVKLGEGDIVLEIENQAIGLIDHYQGLFDKYDALFGLGLVTEDQIPGEPEPPLVRLAQQYKQAPVFGYYLNKFSPGKSKLIFGDGDGNFAVDGFKTHRVQPGPYGGYTGWTLRLDQFIIGDIRSIDLDPGMHVIPDSGSAAISGPKKYMELINQYIFSTANIQVSDKYTFFCSYSQPEQMLAMFEKMPPVHIVIEGETYTLVAQDYIRIGKTVCRSFFDPAEIPVITLGRPFMAKYYTKFDYNNKSVHIAKSVQDHGDHYVIDMLRRLVHSGIEIPENLK